MNRLLFTPSAWDDYLYWQNQDKKTLKRINMLIQSIMRTPFEGEGKPEELRGELADKWSRRIDSQNRIVYLVKDESVTILQCRTHYKEH
ncbi:MAG: Txe/YoeB family addiction module toxin [Victivallales bacterium]|nr:Txe/YoeB family addiction module toxin [Victivallales bacterium]